MDDACKWALIGLLCAGLGLGCSTGPRQRLADCRNRVQALQVENDQARDEAVGLRSRNRDLAQRAVDDARKLRDLEDDNRALRTSLASYQEERSKVSNAYEQFKREVQQQAAAQDDTPSASLPPPPDANADGLERLAAFSRSQPGTTFDETALVWTFPTDRLFRRGSDELSPASGVLLDAFARLLDDPSDPVAVSRVVVSGADAAVVKASNTPDDAPPPGDLAERRARVIADELSRRLKEAPESIATDPDRTGQGAGESGPGGVEIHLRPGPPSDPEAT